MKSITVQCVLMGLKATEREVLRRGRGFRCLVLQLLGVPLEAAGGPEGAAAPERELLHLLLRRSWLLLRREQLLLRWSWRAGVGVDGVRVRALRRGVTDRNSWPNY